MSAHRQQRDTSLADWAGVLTPDPGNGKSLPNDTVGNVAIQIGAGSETGTLPDPTRVGLTLTVTCTSIGAGNRTYTATTAFNVTGNTHFQFTAANHTIQFYSVNAATTAQKPRWQMVFNDGLTLS